jgi:hypothetical protein
VQSSAEGSHQTSLLDALAVAAAVASDGLLTKHMQLDSHAAAGPDSTGELSTGVAATAATAVAAAAAGGVHHMLDAAGSSSEQAMLQAALGQAAAAATSNSAATLSAAAGAAATAPLAAAAGLSLLPFELCDSPHGSNGSAPFDPQGTRLAAVAAEALGGGPYRKSPLLDLADQLGSAAVAAAQAAAQRGQPLSYEAVMQLMQPLEERVREALGAPMQEVPGWQLDDMRRVSKGQYGYCVC